MLGWRRERMPARLPVEVRRWFLQQQARRTQTETAPIPHTQLVVKREGRQLWIRLLEGTAEEHRLLLLEERVTQMMPAMFELLGLSRREAEVLLWVPQGKTNAEIGTILLLSPRTVHAHLEHIYQKLGVETRMAAAMHALESLRLVQR